VLPSKHKTPSSIPHKAVIGGGGGVEIIIIIKKK
jgi:hypothetical protein